MYTERERETDLERLIICSKANAWNILQPNRKPPKTKNKKVSKEMNLRAQTHHQKKKKRKFVITQNSTLHKHKAQCEDACITQLSGPS